MYNGIFDQNDRKVRRFDPVGVHSPLFQQGDCVRYTGEKFGTELNGKVGFVCAHVENEPGAVTVEFGSDIYVMDEANLARAVFKQKEEGEEEDKKKGPKVEKRKGVSKRKADKDTE